MIQKTLENLSLLPDQKLIELADYIDFLLKKSKDRSLLAGIKELETRSSSFHFLQEEEELYNDSDIIEKF